MFSSIYNGPRVLKELKPAFNNPRNSEGDFIKLRRGILYIYSYFIGDSSSDFGVSRLKGIISQDNGENWSDIPDSILSCNLTGSLMSVSLLRLNNGDIALFYLNKKDNKSCIPYLSISTDDGDSWEKPKPCIEDRIGYFVLNNNRVIKLSSGRMIMPVALHNPDNTTVSYYDKIFNDISEIYCYYSDNDGRSWTCGKKVTVPEGVLVQEPGVIELKGKELMIYMRTDEGCQYQAFSKDSGVSWTIAEPSIIKSPLSSASITRIPQTKDLLMVWNNNEVKGQMYDGNRSPLCLAISKNEGKSWQNVKTLEENLDKWFCYTAICFLNDNEILLSYCAGGKGLGTGMSTTKIVKIGTNWIYK